MKKMIMMVLVVLQATVATEMRADSLWSKLKRKAGGTRRQALTFNKKVLEDVIQTYGSLKAMDRESSQHNLPADQYDLGSFKLTDAVVTKDGRIALSFQAIDSNTTYLVSIDPAIEFNFDGTLNIQPVANAIIKHAPKAADAQSVTYHVKEEDVI